MNDLAKAAALFFILAIVATLAAVAYAQATPQRDIPMVRASAPTCTAPKLENPCDRINCYRPDTKRIA